MQSYRNIYLLPEEEHASALLQVQQLASEHKEYRGILKKIASAETQAEEIDTLLEWRYKLTHDKNGDFINRDVTRTTTSGVFTYTPKEESEYAGSLGDDGEQINMERKASGSTFFDLYMEVIQLIAYRIYNMPVVVPISACDEVNPCVSCGWASCKNCPHKF